MLKEFNVQTNDYYILRKKLVDVVTVITIDVSNNCLINVWHLS
jgi:hypothetical protein